MVKGKLIFTKIVQDSQEYGSDDGHMVSRVFFSVELGEKIHKGLYTNIKQTVGSNYETAPLEVSFSRGYKGPLDYGVFREHVERYYRDSFGLSGRMIRMGPGVNLRMRNNIVLMTRVIDIEVDDRRKPSGW
jgi:hypothetical protein